MNRFFFYLAALIVSTVAAQNNEEANVKTAIYTFFEGFHKGDTLHMKSVMMDKVILQTTFTNNEGKSQLVTDDISKLKQKYGITAKLASCHTAIIGGYVIEGHVPAADIKRLLSEKPDIVGLAVPEMPVGTPGMEMGTRKDSFSVLTFDKNGKTTVFKHYDN